MGVLFRVAREKERWRCAQQRPVNAAVKWFGSQVPGSAHVSSDWESTSAFGHGRLRVEKWTAEELRQLVERSAREAVEGGLREMRETIDRLNKVAYLYKDWLTLEEAAQYADITTATLREWRSNGLPEAEVQGRIYIERDKLDSFIASHQV